MSLLKKLEEISIRFDQVSEQIVDPEIISDMDRYVKINREYKELSEIVKVYNKYKDVIDNIASSKEIIATETDKEEREESSKEGQLALLLLSQQSHGGQCQGNFYSRARGGSKKYPGFRARLGQFERHNWNSIG